MRLARAIIDSALVLGLSLGAVVSIAAPPDGALAPPDQAAVWTDSVVAPVRQFTVAASPSLAINEFVPGPARDWDASGAFSSRDDEWIEVVNAGATALDLSHFFVTDGDTIVRYVFSGALAPEERHVVFGKQSYDWERANGYPAFGLSLGNSGDTVMLWEVSGADTALIDAYTYRSHEAAADRAIGRLPDGSGTWMLFDGLNPYTGTAPPHGNGCVPTIAAANACATTPALRATWGGVRARYR